MRIKAITLEGFRNYENFQIELDEKLNIIIGNNAQGKTNLLESIYVSGFGKSFRTNKDNDLIMFSKPYASVRVDIEKDNGYSERIEYRIIKGKKAFFVNGVNITKISDLLGTLNLILFFPDDLKLIKENPTERRKFINRELSHISKLYCVDIIDYNKILSQRNELLKKATYKRDLLETIEIWDEQLTDKAVRIIRKRFEFIKALDEISRSIHSGITSGKERLKVTYETQVSEREDIHQMKSELMALLKKNREMDLKRGFTSVGPHRDDLDIRVNDVDIRSFGSQGQQRTAALSLKLSEIEIIKKEVGERPILLLDDVMSELDQNRQRDLIHTLKEVQTIITTTDIHNLLDDYVNTSKVLQIKNGHMLDH